MCSRMLSFTHDTTRIEIDIADYQFPHLTDDEWDSNWLNVDVALDIGHKHYRRTDPCLTTFELEGLCRWLEEMAHVPVEGHSVAFTEPNLELEISSLDPLTLSVKLSLELIPPWESKPITLDFPITRDHLEEAVRAVANMLARFPRRG